MDFSFRLKALAGLAPASEFRITWSRTDGSSDRKLPMAKHIFQFPCPCCGKRVELNVRNGKARAVKFEESKKGKDLDGLVEDQRHEGTRLGSVFDEARGDQSRQAERMDELFDQATEDAKKDKDKKPFNPFDLE